MSNFKTPLSPTEKLALERLVPAGREEIVDAAFVVAPKHGLDPWLILGLLHIESNFGKALTRGEYEGRVVWTGDFIPRPAGDKIDAYMVANPLPGAKRVQWSRPQIGNLKAFSGVMWVPAHDLRVAKHGPIAAQRNNGSIAGGLGWGWTPFQLDWRWHPEAIKSGAMFSSEGAIDYAIKNIIKPNIDLAKRKGLKGTTLLRASIAAYNAGAKAIDTAVAGGDPATVTAHRHYIDTVLSVAKAAGRSVTV